MIREILSEAGLIEHQTFRETRFLKPPDKPYAVYLDSITRDGADDLALTKHHSISIELYEYVPAPELESALETALDRHFAEMIEGWQKQDRYWLESEQLYQVIYTFDYIEK